MIGLNLFKSQILMLTATCKIQCTPNLKDIMLRHCLVTFVYTSALNMPQISSIMAAVVELKKGKVIQTFNAFK